MATRSEGFHDDFASAVDVGIFRLKKQVVQVFFVRLLTDFNSSIQEYAMLGSKGI